MDWLLSLFDDNTTNPDIIINLDILWVTVAFGALTLIFSILGIVTSFWLSFRERKDRYRQSILANIEYLLKNLKSSFNEIGQSIFYKNSLNLKQAIDSFDIYATLILDELNPQIFASSHNKIEFSVYQNIMEGMAKNSLPLAIGRYNTILMMSKKRLQLPEIKNDKITIQRLTQYLDIFSKKIEKKQKLMVVLKQNPKQIWTYTQKELSEFRIMLEEIWSNLVEGYKQYQNNLTSNDEKNWEVMKELYSEQEIAFQQFRGSLQSLFLE